MDQLQEFRVEGVKNAVGNLLNIVSETYPSRVFAFGNLFVYIFFISFDGVSLYFTITNTLRFMTNREFLDAGEYFVKSIWNAIKYTRYIYTSFAAFYPTNDGQF